jgi:hypothetical protein
MATNLDIQSSGISFDKGIAQIDGNVLPAEEVQITPGGDITATSVIIAQLQLITGNPTNTELSHRITNIDTIANTFTIGLAGSLDLGEIYNIHWVIFY